jgi:UDP-N-acetylglucosamine 3-dehydrogenase
MEVYTMVRIGAVGVGGMGQAHCGSLGKVNNCKFIAVSDVRPEQAKAVGEKFGVKSFTDYNEMFNEVDAITVATPPWQHTQVAVDAAKRGIHVFCEKPLSATLDDADAMIAAADSAKTVLMVGQVLRFYPVHELGRKMIDDGLIGDVVYIETDYCGTYSGPRQKPESWFGKMGGLLENGIHKADLINWYGGDPVAVSGEVGSFSGDPDWEDYTLSLIRYRSQAVGILRWGSFLGSRGSSGTIIDGSKGSMKLDMGSGNVYHKLMGEGDWTESIPPNRGQDGVVAELQHFIDCISEGKKCIVDGREGRKAVEIVLATYKSAKEKMKISLPM